MSQNENAFPPQQQTPPGETDAMTPRPDHGEQSYKGAGRLNGKVALISGGDSGIGRAVAIAFAREGADVAISYYNEQKDAEETMRWVEKAGRRALLLPGDLKKKAHCENVVQKTIETFGKLDVLVNNAAHQLSLNKIEELSEAELDTTFRTNVYSMFFLCQAALPHLKKDASIINTTSINAKTPSPHLIAYASTKGAIANFTAGLAQELGERAIRVNAVAPGPVWTPLIPSTMPEEAVVQFGKNTPLGRAAQPAELASAYVLLASDESSFISGAIIPVTGGRPML
ncbi:glucose 1-dehydrogenase (plasmid) [Kozakia baliensis]|uniref:glucose 1-dehydrogenase n=1 Tax=Kozakia baliensis TaxID=153496 RepID=UPI00345BE456